MSLEISLAGKAALVTGASSGIGRAIAVSLGRAGAAVTLVGRDRTRLDQAVALVEAEGAEACGVARDLKDEQHRREMVSVTVERFGRLDVLVHSAAVWDAQPFADTTLASLDEHWNVNVRAPFALTQAALPHLRGGGSVVFISSISGKLGDAGFSAYGATKGAIELLTRILGKELIADGVRVNAVAPGVCATEMNAQSMSDPVYKATVEGMIPAGRLGRAEEIAPLVTFLASEHASYINGMSYAVDGGWTA
jgi:NAD(P)-dependent dehydrogenase (short-subunit alcohol dehydrogenase family)